MTQRPVRVSAGGRSTQVTTLSDWGLLDRETRFTGVTGEEQKELQHLEGDGRQHFGNFRFDTNSQVSPEEERNRIMHPAVFFFLDFLETFPVNLHYLYFSKCYIKGNEKEKDFEEINIIGFLIGVILFRGETSL